MKLVQLKSARSRVALVAVLVALPSVASADFWARVDGRPWSAWEVDHAIAYCRIQARVSTDVRLFVDVLMGQQIDKCMQSLGWIGVAR
jgi:hypothetical protein